jgi:hypothetical protein
VKHYPGCKRADFLYSCDLIRCPTCPYGGLDMSEALFSNFASADEGVATITWWFNDEAVSHTFTFSSSIAPRTDPEYLFCT